MKWIKVIVKALLSVFLLFCIGSCSIGYVLEESSFGKYLDKKEKAENNQTNMKVNNDTLDNNIIRFTMANYSNINNDHDYYIVAEEECGDYMMVGTFKDMGLSHSGSVGITIFIIIFNIILFKILKNTLKAMKNNYVEG